MIEWLKELDRELLLYLNSFHTPFFDPIMLLITKTLFWLPLYLFLLYLIIKYFKKDWWIVIIGIAVVILLTDRITSGFMKPFFERLRPSREPSLEGLVHLVMKSSGKYYTGGTFGFASSHAANTFGTAMFFWLIFRHRYQWMWVLFVWATVMTYTRIYLGAHYPGDILVGLLIGLGCGWVGYKVQQWIWRKKYKEADALNIKQ
jgi:undecaprenyl-diphosphatase